MKPVQAAYILIAFACSAYVFDFASGEPAVQSPTEPDLPTNVTEPTTSSSGNQTTPVTTVAPITNATTVPPITTTAPDKTTTAIPKPTPPTTTTLTPTTPTTNKPTTPITPTTPDSKPTQSPTTPSAVTTAAPTSTPDPSKGRQFDGLSFIGGIILTVGLVGIAFISLKFYKTRTERNYHTL